MRVKLENITIYICQNGLKVGLVAKCIAEAIKSREMLGNLCVGVYELFKPICVFIRNLLVLPKRKISYDNCIV